MFYVHLMSVNLSLSYQHNTFVIRDTVQEGLHTQANYFTEDNATPQSDDSKNHPIPFYGIGGGA